MGLCAFAQSDIETINRYFDLQDIFEEIYV